MFYILFCRYKRDRLSKLRTMAALWENGKGKKAADGLFLVGELSIAVPTDTPPVGSYTRRV